MQYHFQKPSFFFSFVFIVCLMVTNSTTLQAQEKNTLQLKGLKEKVEVLRDQWGVNHIYANNEHDLFLHKVTVQQKTDCFNLKFGVDKPQAL